MKKYYLLKCGIDFTNRVLFQVFVQKPNPNKDGCLIEKCIWCNDMEEKDHICPNCGTWDEGNFRKVPCNIHWEEITEEEVFLQMLGSEPFKDYAERSLHEKQS